MAKNDNTKGQHVATYTRDKRTGKYLIRVKGPRANEFAGREVPVTVLGSGEKHMEKLIAVKFSGTDDGKFDNKPGPYAVYEFEARPRQDKEIEF